jgi:hypothetical protein
MEIKEGKLLDYLPHAVFTGLPGLVLLYISIVNAIEEEPFMDDAQVTFALLGSIILIAISIGFYSVKSGIEIKTNPNRIRVYKSLFSRKVGRWISLEDLKSVRLESTSESQEFFIRPSFTKTFDLYISYNSNTEVEIHNFTQRHLANYTVKYIGRKFNVPINTV